MRNCHPEMKPLKHEPVLVQSMWVSDLFLCFNAAIGDMTSPHEIAAFMEAHQVFAPYADDAGSFETLPSTMVKMRPLSLWCVVPMAAMCRRSHTFPLCWRSMDLGTHRSLSLRHRTWSTFWCTSSSSHHLWRHEATLRSWQIDDEDVNLVGGIRWSFIDFIVKLKAAMFVYQILVQMGVNNCIWFGSILYTYPGCNRGKWRL